VGVKELAGCFEGCESACERGEVGWLCKGGVGHGLEDVEVGFEGWVVREETEGLEAAIWAYGDVVGHCKVPECGV
jgi:hypothetical protein